VRVDVLDAGADVQRVVVLLGLLVRVERLAVAQRPLALAATAAGRTGGGRGGARRHGSPRGGRATAGRGRTGVARRGRWVRARWVSDTPWCAHDRGRRGDVPRARAGARSACGQCCQPVDAPQLRISLCGPCVHIVG
jgi:hypothetical protein